MTGSSRTAAGPGEDSKSLTTRLTSVGCNLVPWQGCQCHTSILLFAGGRTVLSDRDWYGGLGPCGSGPGCVTRAAQLGPGPHRAADSDRGRHGHGAARARGPGLTNLNDSGRDPYPSLRY